MVGRSPGERHDRASVAALNAAEEDLDPVLSVATLVAMSVDAEMALRDVKNRLSEVVDQVEREHGRVVITRHGKPAAVVISTDDLESLEETLEVVSRPKLIAQVRDSLAELAAGEIEVLSKEDVVAMLRT
jgi:antitoxin YefM